MKTIEGVYVANVTPFRDDGSYDVDMGAYLAHASWLAEKGVRGIVPFGTNGEGPLVGLREKLVVLDRLFEERLPFQILPAVMEGSLAGTLEMLVALEQYPAAAVVVLPPYYYPPSDEGLRRFYEPVIETTNHPVVVYHIPKYAVPVPEEVVAGLPVWGVKDSGGEMGYTEAILGMGKGVLAGTEDDLWEKLVSGVPGVISALANFVPEEVVETYEKARSGDAEGCRALSGRLQRVRAATKEYTSAHLLKKLAEARHGVPMGTVRPPLTPAPADYAPGPVLELAGIV